MPCLPITLVKFKSYSIQQDVKDLVVAMPTPITYFGCCEPQNGMGSLTHSLLLGCSLSVSQGNRSPPQPHCLVFLAQPGQSKWLLPIAVGLSPLVIKEAKHHWQPSCNGKESRLRKKTIWGKKVKP